jgi:hypothetical protein
LDAEFDNKMAEWVRQQREKKTKVSRRTIQMEALKRAVDGGINLTVFFNLAKFSICIIYLYIIIQASEGWIYKFLNRHNFSYRKPTTVCQKPPADYEKKIIDFILFVGQLREKNKQAFHFNFQLNFQFFIILLFEFKIWSFIRG